jgi:hypothetical protein
VVLVGPLSTTNRTRPDYHGQLLPPIANAPTGEAERVVTLLHSILRVAQRAWPVARVADPDDEPTNLDPDGARWIVSLLAELREPISPASDTTLAAAAASVLARPEDTMNPSAARRSTPMRI